MVFQRPPWLFVVSNMWIEADFGSGVFPFRGWQAFQSTGQSLMR
jgi:hypothetical protein